MITTASTRRPASPARRPRALTFIELLIALSITSVVCGILAVLINATAVGTNSQNDGRRSLVRLQALKAGLQDELFNARAILAVGTTYVIYWVGDQPGAPAAVNSAVNLSEMRMLELDTATGNLNLYAIRWPTNTSNSNIISYDTPCAASSDWFSTCTALKANTYYPATVVATGVTGLTTALDSATPTSARMINLRIDTSDGYVTRQLVLGVALVNPLAPY